MAPRPFRDCVFDRLVDGVGGELPVLEIGLALGLDSACGDSQHGDAEWCHLQPKRLADDFMRLLRRGVHACEENNERVLLL